MKTLSKINFHLFCGLSFFSCGTAMMDYFCLSVTSHRRGSGICPISFTIGSRDSSRECDAISTDHHSERFSFLVSSKIDIACCGIASLVCLLLDWASSIFIQIPMNLELNHGKDIVLIEKVMSTNWGRIGLEITQVVLVFIMMIKGEH